MGKRTDQVRLLESEAQRLREAYVKMCRCQQKGTCPTCRQISGEITAKERDRLLGMQDSK